MAGLMFAPGCCCSSPAVTCSDFATGNLVLTGPAPVGTRTLFNASNLAVNASWRCCFAVTMPYTKDDNFLACSPATSGLAHFEIRYESCYVNRSHSALESTLLIRTGMVICPSSPAGYTYIRVATCSGNGLAFAQRDFNFHDDEYPAYGRAGTAIDIDVQTSPAFSVSFTLPATHYNGVPVPFPGDYTITQ
jgi:hypothetical protein